MSAPALQDASSASGSPGPDMAVRRALVGRSGKKSTAEKMFTEDMDRCFLDLLIERKDAIRTKSTGVGFWENLSKTLVETSNRLVREGKLDPPGWPVKQGRQLRDHWDYLVKKWKFALANQGRIGRGKRELFPFTEDVSLIKGMDNAPFDGPNGAEVALAPRDPRVMHAAHVGVAHHPDDREGHVEHSHVPMMAGAHHPHHVHHAPMPEAGPSAGQVTAGAAGKRKRAEDGDELDGAGVQQLLEYMKRRDKRDDKRWKAEIKRRKTENDRNAETQRQLIGAIEMLVGALVEDGQQGDRRGDVAKAVDRARSIVSEVSAVRSQPPPALP